MALAHDPADVQPADPRLDDLICAMGARLGVRAGEEIFAQGEPADLIYLLVDGAVRLSCFAFGGRHPVDVLDTPGDLFGLDPGPRHEMSAEALCDCVVLVVGRRGVALALGEGELAELLGTDAAEASPH